MGSQWTAAGSSWESAENRERVRSSLPGLRIGPLASCARISLLSNLKVNLESAGKTVIQRNGFSEAAFEVYEHIAE